MANTNSAKMRSLVNEAEETKQMTVLNWYILQVAEAIRNCSQIPENTPYLKENSHRNNKIFRYSNNVRNLQNNHIFYAYKTRSVPRLQYRNSRNRTAATGRKRSGQRVTEPNTGTRSCLHVRKNQSSLRHASLYRSPVCIRDIQQKWNLKRTHRWNR